MSESNPRTSSRRLAVGASLIVVFMAAGSFMAGGTAAAFAQQNAAQASPALRGIAHVAMRVADLQTSRDFYQRLGFEEAFASDQAGDPTEAFFKVNDTQFIELYPRRRTGQTVRFLHVCFLSPDIQALNQFYRARGLSPDPVVRGGAGNLLFSLSGPGVESIEFTQYMPGSRHTNDIGKHLGRHRIATRIVAVAFPSGDRAGAISLYANGLAFPRLEGQSGTFHVPGASGEEIEILPGADDHLRITMEVPNLRKAARELKHNRIAVEHQRELLVLRDPDGNEIALERAAAPSPAHRP